MTNEAHHEGRACLGLCVGLLGRGHRANTRAQDSDAHRTSLCPTQDDVTLRWCQPRLELAFTAISLPHLAAIEKQVLLLVDTEGLPIDPQPYVNYATALWDSASLVHARPSRPHNPPLPKPFVCIGRRSYKVTRDSVQPAPPEIFATFL